VSVCAQTSVVRFWVLGWFQVWFSGQFRVLGPPVLKFEKQRERERERENWTQTKSISSGAGYVK